MRTILCNVHCLIQSFMFFPSVDVIVQTRPSLLTQSTNSKKFSNISELSLYIYTSSNTIWDKWMERKCLFIYIVANIYLLKMILLPLICPVSPFKWLLTDALVEYVSTPPLPPCYVCLFWQLLQLTHDHQIH